MKWVVMFLKSGKDNIKVFALRNISVAVLIALVIRTGVWFFPNYSNSLSIIEDPFKSPDLNPEQQYIFGSWLIHAIAHWVGVNSAVGFFLLNLVFVSLFFLIAWAAIKERFTETIRPLVFGLFCLFPASSIIIWWVGMDALTLVLLEIIVLAITKRWRVVSAVVPSLLALQHFEFSFIALILFLIGLLLQRAKDLSSRVFVSIVLLSVSKGLFEAVLASNDIVYVSRFSWMLENLGSSLLMFFWAFLPILWSLFGLFLVFVKWSGASFQQLKHVFVPLVLCLIPVMLSFDQTRTGAVLIFPILFYFLLSEVNFIEINLQKIRPGVLLLISLVPTFIVLSGRVQSGVFMEDIYFAIHAVFNVFDVPSDPATWPFTN